MRPRALFTRPTLRFVNVFLELGDVTLLVVAVPCGVGEIAQPRSAPTATRFAAPSLILHYVAVHRYQPPVVFIAAIMRSTHLEVDDARERVLCLGCGLALERLDETKAVRNGSLESVVLVRLWCDRCATNYERVFERSA